MAHRDEHEAARQRIAALERDLADAKAETERVRSEAEAAAERAPAAKPAAGKSGRTKREKRKREKPSVIQAVADDPRWRPGARPRFTRSIAALGALAYGGAALTQLLSAPLVETVVMWASGAAVFAMLVGAFVLGRLHRAPEPLGGALVTLLIAPLVLGVVVGACTDELWPDLIPPGPLRLVARLVVVVATLAIGIPTSAAWVTEAASSPIQPD